LYTLFYIFRYLPIKVITTHLVFFRQLFTLVQ